jgi:chromosome segregation ATPase
MSDVQTKDTEANPTDDTNEVVPKKAYKEVSADLHKFKSQARELNAQLQAIKADQEARDKAVLEEQQKWSELYKRSESKLSQLQAERQQEREQFVESHKRNSVIQQLGGFKKEAYSKFIDSSKIEIFEDGSINPESVELEVARLRKEYPELIKQSPKQGLPDAAPKAMAERDYSQLNAKERQELKASLLKK